MIDDPDFVYFAIRLPCGRWWRSSVRQKNEAPIVHRWLSEKEARDFAEKCGGVAIEFGLVRKSELKPGSSVYVRGDERVVMDNPWFWDTDTSNADPHVTLDDGAKVAVSELTVIPEELGS